jgi:hypothetical protein
MAMKTEDLIKEIQSLPIDQRIDLAEKIIHSLREKIENEQLELAAKDLLSDYQSDGELVAFASLDQEDFYETR